MVTVELAALIEAEARTRKLRAVLALERRVGRQLRRTWRAQSKAALAALARFAGDFDEALREAIEIDDIDEPVTSAIRSDPQLVMTVQIVTERALAAGAASTFIDLAVDGTFDLDHPDAVTFLRGRAADRVAGIDDVTRRFVRTVLVQAADGGWSYQGTAKALRDRFVEFSAPVPQQHLRNRAELIAVTEVGEAYEHGARIVADELAVGGLVLEKAWLTVGDERVCPICGPNEAAGYIARTASFPSGHDGPLGHPACRCTATWRAREPKSKERT